MEDNPSQTVSAMQDNPINILSTRPLQDEWVAEANAMGIIIDQLSFIETEPVVSIEVQQEIEQTLILSATVVFTSMNAAEAVVTWMDGQKPDWKIYCIGFATKELVKNSFGEESIAGTSSSAAELAAVMIENGHTDEVIFFCGDQRRDELPEILRSNGMEVNEINVYQTITMPHHIKKKYAGILFFSPSAVQSFFSVNKINSETILFAIGNTTANEIKKYNNNKILISDQPGKENLLRKMMEYFGDN